MGITIFWTLVLKNGHPLDILRPLRDWAIGSKLFAEVGVVKHFVGIECDYKQSKEEDGWTLIQAQDTFGPDKPPIEIWRLGIWFGEGCEVTNISFARCGPQVSVWKARAFTKTHYAKDFVTAHMSICAIFDFLKKCEKLTVEIKDEGGYWEKRDPRALVKELEEWNEGMIKMATSFKKVLGEKVSGSAIERFAEDQRALESETND